MLSKDVLIGKNEEWNKHPSSPLHSFTISVPSKISLLIRPNTDTQYNMFSILDLPQVGGASTTLPFMVAATNMFSYNIYFTNELYETCLSIYLLEYQNLFGTCCSFTIPKTNVYLLFIIYVKFKF